MMKLIVILIFLFEISLNYNFYIELLRFFLNCIISFAGNLSEILLEEKMNEMEIGNSCEWDF